MPYKLIDICLPDGSKVQIEIVHLDELLRRGIRDTQGSILYWERKDNHVIADAMRKIGTNGEKVRAFLEPHI